MQIILFFLFKNKAWQETEVSIRSQQRLVVTYGSFMCFVIIFGI